MNPIYSGTLGISAAVVSALAEPSAAAEAQDATAPQRSDLPAAERPRDLLAPEPVGADAALNASDPAQECDDKCKVVVLTEQTLPGLGASEAVGVLLSPKEHGVSILKDDGTPAVTFTVMPTKLTRGQGLIVFGTF